MTTSEQLNEISAALSKAQGEMENATKDSANPFFRSKYADLASVREAVRVPLAKHGLAVVQFPKTEYLGTPEPYEWTAKSGEKRYGVRVCCVVSVLTRLTHASGQWLEDSLSTMLPTGDPQAVGSAITYLRRYALQSVAGVAPEDDDGEAAHTRGVPPQTAKPVTAAPAGYQDWLDDLVAVSDDGTPRLEKAWKASKAEYREYLMATDRKRWEAIKAHAARLTNEIPA
jgi:hypothetical protein